MDSYNFRDRSQGAGRSDYNIHHKILICSDIRRDVCRNHSEGRSFVYKLGLCTNRHSILFFGWDEDVASEWRGEYEREWVSKWVCNDWKSIKISFLYSTR